MNLIHQGISSRSFERKFTFSDEVQVKEAELKDGMLRIQLKKIIPEHKKPKLLKLINLKELAGNNNFCQFFFLELILIIIINIKIN